MLSRVNSQTQESKNNHLMDQDQFLQKINKDQIILQQNLQIQDRTIQQINNILQEANKIIQIIQQLIADHQNQVLNFQKILLEQISMAKSQNFCELDEQIVNKLLNINNNFSNDHQIFEIKIQSDILVETIQQISSINHEYMDQCQKQNQAALDNKEDVNKNKLINIQNQKICQIHNTKNIEFFCFHPFCKKRFLCSFCMRDDIHRHRKSNNNHILNQVQILEAVIVNIKKIKTIYQFHWFNLKQILNAKQNQIKELSNQIDFIQKQLKMFDQYVEMLKYNSLSQYNQDNLLQYYYIEQYYLQYNLSVDLVRHVQLMENKSDLEQNKIFDNYFNVNFDDIFRQEKGAYYFFHRQYPFNELIDIAKKDFLLILKAPNIESNMPIRYFQSENDVSKIKLTNDDKYLFLGDIQGFIYKWDVLKDEVLFKQQIHQDRINQILILTENLILTASYDKCIKTIDINFKTILFCILNAHESIINGLDYDSNQNIIASCSSDQFIKLWIDKETVIQLTKNSSGFKQIFFLKNKEKLVSQDFNNQIDIWLILFDKKIIQKLHTINNSEFKSDISVIFNQQYISLPSRVGFNIYSSQGKLIRIVDLQIQSQSAKHGVYLQSISHDSLDLIACKNASRTYLIIFSQF